MKSFCAMLVHDEVPPSLNAGGAGSRRHWSAAHKDKMRWEGIFLALMLEAKVPKGMSHCDVAASLTFKEKRRRDSENYRPGISKPFADMAVKAGFIPDDTDEFFTLSTVSISTDRLKSSPGVKARIVLYVLGTYDD